MRSLLRPGLHVIRRDESAWQIGLDPRSAVVLSAGEPTDALLRRLGEGSATDADDLVRELGDRGLVQAADTAHRLLPATLPPTMRHDRAAVVALDGDTAARTLDQRRDAHVGITSFGGPAGALVAQECRRLLTFAGIGLDDRAPRTVALVGVGEPDRTLLDPLVRASTPHTMLRVVAGTVTVGPTVEPGQTACLRCLDAHHIDADPGWPLVLAQYAARDGSDRADGVPEPVDALLAALGVAWLSRDLTSLIEGRRPSTWSATTRLDPALSQVEHQAWLRHPACGCGWADDGADDGADANGWRTG